MTEDAEIKAMGSIAEALDGLESEAIARILRWAGDRYGVTLGATGKTRRAPEDVLSDNAESEETDFEDFADLYDAADPQTDVDRALVAGYWIQVVKDGQDFQAQPANKLLKDMGHGINNITSAMDGLINQSPRLAVQKQKKGSSRQARKVYKVTTAGERYVQGLIQGGGES
jgi:hypothetical protein